MLSHRSLSGGKPRQFLQRGGSLVLRVSHATCYNAWNPLRVRSSVTVGKADDTCFNALNSRNAVSPQRTAHRNAVARLERTDLETPATDWLLLATLAEYNPL
ncbi:hypothetical protein LC593_00195 [Nostoc sp. CHAB 5844]|nr:hypothetical protein [Nostoc sp. CHAB 5844]